MKLDQHLLTNALRLVRQSSGRTHPAPIDTGRTACLSDRTYEPACINVWAEMVKATDEMVRAAA